MSRLHLPLTLGLAIMLLQVQPATAQVAGQWRDSAQVWRTICAHCHGAGIAKPLFGTALPPVAITTLTRNGFNSMPAFTAAQISDEELAALAAWLRAQPPAAPPAR